MGAVWRAEHLGWEAPVAVKLMNRDVAAQPEARARFEREVRLAAELRSPHVVQVLDHGVDERTRIPFIAMELLEGESLEARLRRKGSLSPVETHEIVSQLVRALSRAHEAGVVHRDLKPENVFLVRNDEQSLVKVLDFGIAKGSRASLAVRLTRPGRVLGTPFYMSPEQFRGTREIDHRADLWSLSAIVCECLTGRRPFEARDLGELALLLLRNSGRPLPSALGAVPAGFDAWFLRATHPDIEQRFQSARELGSALARVCGDGAAQGLAFGPTEQLPTQSSMELPGAERLRSGARRRWTPARVAGVCLLACVPVAAGALWQYQRQQRAARGQPGAETAGVIAAETAVPQTVTLSLRPPPAEAAAPVPLQPLPVQPLPVQPVPVQPVPVQPVQPVVAQSAESERGAPSVAKARLDQGAEPSAAPRKERKARPAKSARRERKAREPVESAPSPLDVNGRPIRMTLDAAP
jgi:hypothetical protein